MPAATIPGSRPGLVTIPGVELCRVGTWATSTGVFDFTLDDFAAAQAAEADPDWWDAPIKIGHIDQRFVDGEPAFGWVRNLRTQGDRLLGDLTDMPAALAALVDVAYPRRSIEMGFQVHTPGGARYRAAVVGLALLGVTPPAVAGLADVAALYDGTRPFELAAATAARCAGGVATVIVDPTWYDARGLVAHLAARAGLDGSVVIAAVDELAVMPPASSPTAAGGADTLARHVATSPPGGLMPEVTDRRVREILALEATADAEAALVALRDRAAAAPPAPVTPPPPVALVPGTGPFLPTGYTPPAPAAAPPAPAAPAGYAAPPGFMLVPAPPAGTIPAPAAVTPPAPVPVQPPAPVATAPAPPPVPAPGPVAVPTPVPAPAGDTVAALAAAVAAHLAPSIAAAAAPGAQVAEVMRVRDREAMLAGHARRGALRPTDLDYYRAAYDANATGTIAHLAAMPPSFPTFELGAAAATADSVAANAEADRQFLASCGITDIPA